MKKLTKYDQNLIRKKIDEILTPAEQEYFDHLMETTPEALDFYRKEKMIDHVLKVDSGKIPEIDLSNQIILHTDTLNANAEQNTSGIRHMAAFHRRQILLYAAILMIGVVIGSVSVYLATSPERITNRDMLSGTISKSSETRFLYFEGETGISVQNYSGGEFRMVIAEVETTRDVVCTFNEGFTSPSSPKIDLLFSNGDFQISQKENGEQFIICSGRNIFLVKSSSQLNTGSISFTRNGKLIYEYKTGP